MEIKGLTIIADTTAHPMEDEILRQAVRYNEWHQNPSDTAKPMKINKNLACVQPGALSPQEKSGNAPSPIFLREGAAVHRLQKVKYIKLVNYEILKCVFGRRTLFVFNFRR